MFLSFFLPAAVASSLYVAYSLYPREGWLGVAVILLPLIGLFYRPRIVAALAAASIETASWGISRVFHCFEHATMLREWSVTCGNRAPISNRSIRNLILCAFLIYATHHVTGSWLASVTYSVMLVSTLRSLFETKAYTAWFADHVHVLEENEDATEEAVVN